MVSNMAIVFVPRGKLDIQRKEMVTMVRLKKNVQTLAFLFELKQAERERESEEVFP